MANNGIDKPVVILYLIDTRVSPPGIPSSGGAEKQLYQLASGLNPDLFKPVLIQLTPNSSHVGKGRIGNLDLYHFPMRRFYDAPGIYRIGQICRLARLKRAEIIHTFFEKSEIVGWLICKLLSNPLWVTSRRDLGFKRKKIYRKIFKFSSSDCARVIANCLAVKEQAVRWENLPDEKIDVIHNGLDFSRYEMQRQNGSLRKELGIFRDTPLIGMVANFNFEIKGHAYFIEAAKVLLERSAMSSFILVGDGALKTKYEKMANVLGLKEKVLFLGKRDDVPSILSNLDISVLCSTSEGLSNVILESMAAGKPVVATDVGGISELVKDGINGFVVPPADPRAIADAIETLLRNPLQAVQMGQMGKIMVKEKFSQKKMLKNYEKLYLSLLNDKRRRPNTSSDQ